MGLCTAERVSACRFTFPTPPDIIRPMPLHLVENWLPTQHRSIVYVLSLLGLVLTLQSPRPTASRSSRLRMHRTGPHSLLKSPNRARKGSRHHPGRERVVHAGGSHSGKFRGGPARKEGTRYLLDESEMHDRAMTPAEVDAAITDFVNSVKPDRRSNSRHGRETQIRHLRP